MKNLILGFGIGALIFSGLSFALAKKQSNPLTIPTIQCTPTGSSKNDLNAEANCDYLAGEIGGVKGQLQEVINNQVEDHEHLHQILLKLGVKAE